MCVCVCACMCVCARVHDVNWYVCAHVRVSVGHVKRGDRQKSGNRMHTRTHRHTERIFAHPREEDLAFDDPKATDRQPASQTRGYNTNVSDTHRWQPSLHTISAMFAKNPQNAKDHAMHTKACMRRMAASKRGRAGRARYPMCSEARTRNSASGCANQYSSAHPHNVSGSATKNPSPC
jgi:hypothetical protein